MTPEEFRSKRSSDVAPGLEPIPREPRPKAPRPKRGQPRTSTNPPGNAPYVPTTAHRNSVITLRGGGVPLDTIAQLLGVAPATVEKHFRRELDTGKEQIVARISAKVIAKALAGDNTAAIFYLRCFGGEQWRDKQRLEHAGIDGAPLNPPNLVISFLQPHPLVAAPDADTTPAATPIA